MGRSVGEEAYPGIGWGTDGTARGGRAFRLQRTDYAIISYLWPVLAKRSQIRQCFQCSSVAYATLPEEEA